MTMEEYMYTPHMESDVPDGQENHDQQELSDAGVETVPEPEVLDTLPEEAPKKKRASRKKAEKTAEDAPDQDGAAGETVPLADAAPDMPDEIGSSFNEDLPEALSAEDDSLEPGDSTAGEEADQFVVMGLAEEAPAEPELAVPEYQALEVEGDDPGTEAPLMDSTAEVPDPEVPLPQPRNAPRPRPVSERARLKTAEDHASLLSLKLNRLDRDLTEQERQEWNDIYASFRAKSVLTGKVIGVDGHTFNVRNRETGALERRVMHCAVIIQYRVKVLIPETEMWVPGQERPSHVLRSMTGAEIGYTILDVDRKGGVAIASRRMAAVSLCRAFDNVRGGHFIGERLPCRVLTVGPNRCLLECGGRDLTLGYRDMLYASCPDLRERFRPGDQPECILKEYSRRSGAFAVSVKESQPHPFIGVTVRHPLGSRRQATISGKYGGGVFCTMADDTTCLCLYTALHTDRDFQIGDEVLLVVSKFDYEHCLIYGRILSKW